MKKSQLVAFVSIVAAIAIIVSASRDVSTYATFEVAKTTQGKVKIAGEIDQSGEIIYDPVNSPNIFTFKMKDDDNKSMDVIVKLPKPQDFEESETVVVTGKIVDNKFMADDVLLKCPSKYKDEELKLKTVAS